MFQGSSSFVTTCAAMVELVDTPDSKSCELYARAGSSPARGTSRYTIANSDIVHKTTQKTRNLSGFLCICATLALSNHCQKYAIKITDSTIEPPYNLASYLNGDDT
jgi:hypothetical protein